MNTTQETSVTSSQDRCRTTVEGVTKKVTKIIGETKTEFNGGKSTIEELFPWIIEFKKKCRCSLAQLNIVSLIKLMKFYSRNVSINVNECYTKPYRAAKLKDSISETLLFFLFYFRELVEVCDKNSYLDKMSDLLAMYLDMELKASRRGKEHHSKIAARLTSCLYVYLENSSEHILDTFIKARFINRNYQEILDPVLTKISKNLPAHPNCDTMYVRYLLIYRLWKKVNIDAAVKNQINATAILHLGPPPPSPTPFLAKYVLPKVPKSQANSTKFLLLHKFDIEKSCRLFIQYCKENREDEDQGDLDKPNFVANSISSDTLDTLGGRGTNHVDNLIDNVNILPEGERRQRTQVAKTDFNNLGGKFATQEFMKPQRNTSTKHESGEISPLKQLRPAKGSPRLKTKKTGDILFIDLTEDEITEKVIKKKKHRKLHWLTEVKKKLSSKSIKASEKKKKSQNIVDNLIDDLTLPGLVDSTSAGSLFDGTTREPEISSPITPSAVKSLFIQEPENCVTSNSAESSLTLRLNSVNSESNKKQQLSCDVTTTVTELLPITESNSQKIILDSVPSSNRLPENHHNIISKVNKIDQQKSEAWTSNELPSALNHICESYDSDHSAMDTGGNDNSESTEIEKEEAKSTPVESKSEAFEAEKLMGRMESDKDSKKPQGVIFTRSFSDGEIQNLDDCVADNSEFDVKDLTLRTHQLKLTNSLEIPRARKESENEKSSILDLCETESGAVEEESSDHLKKLKSKSKTNNPESIEASKKEYQSQRKASKKLEASMPINYDNKKHCDYVFSEGTKLQRDNLDIANQQPRIEIIEKKAPSVHGGCVEERISIPKINEILICPENGENNIRNISNELLESQEPPEFNENIDGLSLLASVSQHVSNLEEYSEKLLSKPKILNGEVPRKNPLEINTVIKKRIENIDSYELLLDLNVNSSTGIVSEIVGVPHHQINDNKINESENYKRIINESVENNSSDVVPLILETTVDLNSSTLHNNLISVENVTQMIKESTNVIVNGETVVLFQKSPNSNLYIINKAADSTTECLSEDKKHNIKNIERSSTAMRDIINHIPINLSDKNGDRQDGGKTQRSRTSGSNNKNKRVEYSSKKYESLLLPAKQFEPIGEEFLQCGDNKLGEEYIKKEIFNSDGYEDIFRQRCTDTPGSVIELDPVKKSPPPIIRLTDTPDETRAIGNQKEIHGQEFTATTTGRLNENSRKRGEISSLEDIKYKQNIKKEFQNFDDNLNTNEMKICDTEQVIRQNYANINPGHLFSLHSNIHPAKVQHVYSAVGNATSLYDIEGGERCGYPKCNLKVNSTQSYQSIPPQSVQNCQLSYCACLKCAYEVHCGQYVQRPNNTTTTHPSYIQSDSYFLSNDSQAKECVVEERELKMNEAALAKLKDDQLLHNIEQSIIDDNKQLNNVGEVKTVQEIKYKAEFDNKLPLKKRLKAHAMLSMSFSESAIPIKIEKVENYPGTPMMSIAAALETGDVSQNDGCALYGEKSESASELSPRVKDDSLTNHTREMIRRDYLKDCSSLNAINVDERVKKLDHQRRQTNGHVNIMGTGCVRSFKTPAQRKEILISSPSSLKRPATTATSYVKSPAKKAKNKIKSTVNSRQTRSSKRNIPKVDYSYDGIVDTDTKFNSLNEIRKKRKKTSR